MSEEAWHKGAAYSRQYRTGEQIAPRPAEHFEEHAAHLCRLRNIEQEGNQCFLAPDKILFVLANSESTGAGLCDFPVVEQGLLAFRYSSSTLEISLQGSATWLTGSHLMDVHQPEIIGLGFFGYHSSSDYSLGGGIHNEIYYIDGLTYEVPSLSFVVYSVLNDGTMVAGVGDQVYQFEANQSWIEVSSHREERQPDCQITSSFSITNYGFLNRSDVKFVNEAILP